jgi:hypothetical protein
MLINAENFENKSINNLENMSGFNRVTHQPLTWTSRLMIFFIAIEYFHKYRNGIANASDSLIFFRFSFISTYFFCTIPIFLDLKQTSLISSENFRWSFSLLHMIDSISILMVGYGMFHQSKIIFLIGLLFSAKFMFLSLASRMVTGNKAVGIIAEIEELTKVFIHHFGSFLLIDDPLTIMLTGIWRAISISGHAVLALRRKLSSDLYDKLNWLCVHLRTACMFLIILLSFMSPELRKGLAVSALGHVAYMVVRLSAVFRMGSIYLTSEEKDEWNHANDSEKIKILVSLRYPWFLLELATFSFTIAYFLILRLFLFF